MRKEKKWIWIWQGCGLLLAVLALSLNLSYGTGAYWEHVDGWGIDMFAVVVGLAVIFFHACGRQGQKDLYLNIACVFFALWTLLGRSFMEAGSWDILFSGKVQVCKTFLIGGGYFLFCKNSILFAGWLLEQIPSLFRVEVHGRVEKWLFEKFPVLGPALALWILELPWLIFFFPGSLDPDGWGQIHMNYGIDELTTHDPIVATRLMGMAMEMGRTVFGSNSMGLFIYTFVQFGIQSFTVAYVIYVMGRMKAPVPLRWGALAFYGIYPISLYGDILWLKILGIIFLSFYLQRF